MALPTAAFSSGPAFEGRGRGTGASSLRSEAVLVSARADVSEKTFSGGAAALGVRARTLLEVGARPLSSPLLLVGRGECANSGFEAELLL